MAGKKITELGELGAIPASGDWLVIVDVSDTSESAEGTTKKVAVSDAIPSQITSGEWTPTFQTNYDGVTNIKCTYIAFQDYVDVVCNVLVDNASQIGDGDVQISAPVGLAMDESDETNCRGLFYLQNAASTTFINTMNVQLSTVGDNGSIEFGLQDNDPPIEYEIVLIARYKRA